MRSGVLLELELVLLVVCSLVAPAGLMLSVWSLVDFAANRAGLCHAADCAGWGGRGAAAITDRKARRTPDLPGMQLFTDQLALVLYVCWQPWLAGVNLLSHVPISHLGQAERRFDHQHNQPCHQHALAALADGACHAGDWRYFLLDLYGGNDIRQRAVSVSTGLGGPGIAKAGCPPR